VLLEYWNICWDIFLRYCAWKSFSVCVLGWSWYIYALWVAALLIFLFGIHLTAVINTTLCLKLAGSNGIFGDISDCFFQGYDIQRLPAQWLTDASFGKLTIVEVGCSIFKGLGIWYLEDLCSSLLGHLQTLLYFPIVLDFRTFLSVDIITLFTLVFLRH
jgi:hypothetical protein